LGRAHTLGGGSLTRTKGDPRQKIPPGEGNLLKNRGIWGDTPLKKKKSGRHFYGGIYGALWGPPEGVLPTTHEEETGALKKRGGCYKRLRAERVSPHTNWG